MKVPTPLLSAVHCYWVGGWGTALYQKQRQQWPDEMQLAAFIGWLASRGGRCLHHWKCLETRTTSLNFQPNNQCRELRGSKYRSTCNLFELGTEGDHLQNVVLFNKKATFKIAFKCAHIINSGAGR